MAGTYTPNRHLYKPAVNEVGWADAVNAGFDNLDNAASNGVNDVTIQDPSGNGMAVDSASNQTELISNDTLVINSAGHGSLTFGIGSDFSLQSRGAALIQASVGGASMTIGGNVSFTGTTVTGPTPSTGDNSTKFATTAFVKAQNYATASSLAAIASSGSWSDLQNATAPLVLNNGANGTEIDQSSAVTIAFKNTTAATSGTSQSSPILDVSGTYWNGSASAEDKWTIQDVVGNGTNGTSTLTFSHSGSSGNSIVSLPKLLINNDFAVLPYLAIAGGYSGGNPTTASVYAQASSSSLRLASGATLLWAATSDARTGATDTGISRISAGVLALGNGTAGDTTGSLQCNNITEINSVAATSSVSQSSPTHTFSGTYWNSSASAPDAWTIQNVVANGTNGNSILSFVHSGTTGTAAIGIPDGSSSKPALVFTSDPTTGIYKATSAFAIACPQGFVVTHPGSNSSFLTAGANNLQVASIDAIGWSSGNTPQATANDTGISRASAGVMSVDTSTKGNSSGNLQLNQIAKYNGETTAGIGTSYLRGSTSQKSETGADANVLTVTPAAAVGSYRLRVVISVSAASAATIGWTATWTDSNGNAQSPTNLALTQAGAAAPALTFTTSAAGNYYAEAQVDVNNAGTNIVIKTTFSGTSVAYKISATIERII